MQETWVQSLEKEMATRSSILAWKIPWTEEPIRLQRVGHDWVCAHRPAPNMGVEISLRDPAFSSVRYISSGRIPGLYGNSTFNFLRNYRTVYKASTQFKIPASSVQGFRFLNILAKTYYYLSFFISHPSICELVSSRF